MYVIGLFVCFIALVILYNLLVVGPRMRREAEAAPRITMDEVKPFWDRLEQDRLPFAKIHLRPDGEPQVKGSRIGGVPMRFEDESDWPVSQVTGRPMMFLGQVDFSEVRGIEDFPENGILQVFTSFEMIGDDGECERVIRWDAEPSGNAKMDMPEGIKRQSRHTKFFSNRARQTGLCLDFEPGVAIAHPYIWPYNEEGDVYLENRLPENDAVARIIDTWEERADEISESYGTHWMGGYPRFVQEDIRVWSEKFQKLDRTLLHLGWDDDIQLGDAGEANLMISREDLIKRNFQKSVLTWDCS